MSCSKGIDKVQEKSASIDAQKTQKFVFNLRTSKREADTFMCTGMLFAVLVKEAVEAARIQKRNLPKKI